VYLPHATVATNPDRMILNASQSSAGRTGDTMSPRVRPLARRACCGNFARLAGSGRTMFTTSRPRFEIAIGSPVRATSSMIARQRALNRDAGIDFI
jgi:hypothetical protein